jgi:hypothetical protein
MTHTEIANKYSEIIMKETLEMLTELENQPKWICLFTINLINFLIVNCLNFLTTVPVFLLLLLTWIVNLKI